MGKKIERNRSKTLPSSPTHSFSSSSSSSDFEFRISLSPRKSSAALCPADQLFYKGQLLPLHLSPRISMVRTLLLASSSTSSSSDTTTTASRDSSSSNDSTASSTFAADLSLLGPGDPCCDSSRPSSATDDDDHLIKRLPPKKYFSLSRFSNVFKKDSPAVSKPAATDGSSVKKMSSSAKEVIRRYLKKVKPLYEKLSQNKQQRRESGVMVVSSSVTAETSDREMRRENGSISISSSNSGSFSGNLKCPRMIRRSYVASCPSSMRSSPSHSGVLSRAGLPVRAGIGSSSSSSSSDTSTMEELQNAIQGAIAHCKNSMLQSSSSNFYNNNSYNNKGKAIEI